MGIRTTFSYNEFYETIKNKVNEFSENKPTYWGQGSIARAFAQAVAYFCEFLQLQINIAYMSMRVSTAKALHLDRRVEDFNLSRNAATNAISLQQFNGSTGRTTDITIPAQTVVQTEPDYFGNIIRYELNNTLILTTGAVNVTGYATCTQLGSIGNVLSGAINTLATPIVGISGTTNVFSISNGTEDETDDALKARVPSHILGLKRANYDSIIAAAYSVEGVTYAEIIENHPAQGNFTLYVTTRTGILDPIQQAQIRTAVDDARAFCITPTIITPIVSGVTLEFDVEIDSSIYQSTPLLTLIKNQLKNYVNNIGKNILYRSDIVTQTKKISGVKDVNVGTVKINGVLANLELSKLFVIKIEDVEDITINLI